MDKLHILKTLDKKPKYDGKINYDNRIITDLGTFYSSNEQLKLCYKEITMMIVYGNFFSLNNESFENFPRLEYLDISNMSWVKYTDFIGNLLRSKEKKLPLPRPISELFQLNNLKNLLGLKFNMTNKKSSNFQPLDEKPDYSWINFLPNGLEEIIIDNITKTNISNINLNNIPSSVKIIRLNKFHLISDKFNKNIIEFIKTKKIPQGTKIYICGNLTNLLE
jgi:hypothetical protein